MATALPDLNRLRPAGTKRSSKRDLIVNVFLRQEGHLSADDLVDLIKRDDQRTCINDVVECVAIVIFIACIPHSITIRVQLVRVWNDGTVVDASPH